MFFLLPLLSLIWHQDHGSRIKVLLTVAPPCLFWRLYPDLIGQHCRGLCKKEAFKVVQTPQCVG